MNTKIVIITLLASILLIVILAVFGNRANEQNFVVSEDGAVIPCLPNGHQQVAQHIHPTLSIIIDGESEVIPANLGIEGTCMREVHTHDETGSIHIETALPNKEYKLTDFFAVWGQELEREGYNMTITQNGETVESPSELVLIDYADIVIEYTSQLQRTF